MGFPTGLCNLASVWVEVGVEEGIGEIGERLGNGWGTVGERLGNGWGGLAGFEDLKHYV